MDTKKPYEVQFEISERRLCLLDRIPVQHRFLILRQHIPRQRGCLNLLQDSRVRI